MGMHHGGHRRQRCNGHDENARRFLWGLQRPLGQAVQLQVRQLELKQLEPEPWNGEDMFVQEDIWKDKKKTGPNNGNISAHDENKVVSTNCLFFEMLRCWCNLVFLSSFGWLQMEQDVLRLQVKLKRRLEEQASSDFMNISMTVVLRCMARQGEGS